MPLQSGKAKEGGIRENPFWVAREEQMGRQKEEARYVVLPSSTFVRERLPAHCPPKAQKVLCTSKVAVHPPKRTYYTLGTPPALAQN